ncbi:MAG: hypothetical protein ABFC84_01900 [Veillonellales bacterium]
MADNLIDFSKFTVDKQSGINIAAAKKYFIEEILPYVGEVSLQRLIKANFSENQRSIQLEMMRMFIESELMRPDTTEESRLRLFFAESEADKSCSGTAKQ